jgi:peptidoglycan hydrolase CwlO-like protein
VSYALNLSLLTHSHDAAAAGTSVSAGSDSAAALQAQITSDQAQLNDWVTCVSASTPKGKAEIAAISGRISAAKEHIARIRASAAASQSAAPAATQATTPATPRAGRVDLWV